VNENQISVVTEEVNFFTYEQILGSTFAKCYDELQDKTIHHISTLRERCRTDPFLVKDVELLSVERKRKRKQEKIRLLKCNS
jgi:hypothetical protein